MIINNDYQRRIVIKALERYYFYKPNNIHEYILDTIEQDSLKDVTDLDICVNYISFSYKDTNHTTTKKSIHWWQRYFRRLKKWTKRGIDETFI